MGRYGEIWGGPLRRVKTALEIGAHPGAVAGVLEVVGAAPEDGFDAVDGEGGGDAHVEAGGGRGDRDAMRRRCGSDEEATWN